MKHILVLCFVLYCVSGAWPPTPNTQPRIGIDTPGGDFPGMPLTLSKADYNLCAQMCEEKTGCRAWAYAVPGCDSYQKPMCWLKFADPHNGESDKCRVSGLSSRLCQMETQWTKQVDPTNPLPEYPRPQLTRPDSSWKNLNGLWEFQPGQQGQNPPFGQKLSEQILVPFPVESCLSGIAWTYEYLWYRLVFDVPADMKLSNYMLHFGAVDWQTTVYLNKNRLGVHTGGYDPFSFDVTSSIQRTNNELIVFVYDPSDHGRQVFGKQRLSAILNPGGDTYSPNSGIWQTVWLENVPRQHVQSIKIQPNTNSAIITVNAPSTLPVNIAVYDGSTSVAQASGNSGQAISVRIPNAKLWQPGNGFLYDLKITLNNGQDVVGSYMGLRNVTLGKDSKGVTRPMINGKFEFLAGWLDQSWWPDGIYTAPTDEALAFDLKAISRFGYNFVRLHQKVNSQRWYWHADRLGVVVQQDMVQHYGSAFATPDPQLYMNDLKAMIDNTYNHPCIFQWTAFNEGDMVAYFNASYVVKWIKEYDPSRLVDTDSGGPANDLHVGDVNDIHDYPDPQDPKPSNTQYAEIGEFGGLGAFIPNHQWVEGACYAYKTLPNPNSLAQTYIGYINTILSRKNDISVSVYTQITDTELECDGFYNMDRTDKFDEATIQSIASSNQKLIHT